MSSHHVVRERQEPALAIATESADSELLGALLEWSPTVILIEPSSQFIKSLWFKVDIVIAMHSKAPSLLPHLQQQWPFKLLQHQHSALTCMMNFLIKKEYTAVNLLAPMRASLVRMLQAYGAHLDICIYDRNIRWVYGRAGKFKKWVKKDTDFSWIKGRETLIINGKKISDTAYVSGQDGWVTFTSKEPFWLGERF